MSNVQDNLQTIKTNIKNISQRPVCIIAVSKGVTAAKIREAAAAGITQFAENNWPKTRDKQRLLQDLNIEWHYIGWLQRRLCKTIAKNYSWVQSLAKLEHAIQLNTARAGSPPLNVLIQVNITGSEQQAGCRPDELDNLAQEIKQLSNLRLRGIMGIASQDNYCNDFALLYKIYKKLQQKIELDVLSMGMSNDYIAAVAANSTMLRLGKSLFGE